MKNAEIKTTDSVLLKSEISDWIGGLRSLISLSGINNLYVKGIKKKRKRNFTNKLKLLEFRIK